MVSSLNREGGGARGRPPIGDPDGRIVDAVTDTFWRLGFARTGIGELAAAAGTARASLYKLFGDKAGALAAALDRYAARYGARVSAILAETADPAQAVRRSLAASVDRLSDPDAPPGCLRCRTTLELGDPDPRVAAALARAHAAFDADTRRLLRADGRPDGPEVERLAAFLTMTTNGLVIMAEAGAGREVIAASAGLAADAVARRLDR